MTGIPALVTAALAVVLVERFVLDRRLGRPSSYCLSSNSAAALADAGFVAGLLTLGAALAWPVAVFVLVPAHAEFCYGAVLVAVVSGLALAARPLLARQRNHSIDDRRCIRAAVVSSLIGIAVLVPQSIAGAGRIPAFMQYVGTAAIASAVYVIIRFIYGGIREHMTLVGNGRSQSQSTLVSEVLTAGLTALACAGLPFLSIPGLLKMTGSLSRIILAMAATALAAGAMAFIARRIRNKNHVRFDRVRRAMPGFDCGACGFAGCIDYAAAVAEGRTDGGSCVPGGAKTAHGIADALGTAAVIKEPVMAVVHCNGGIDQAKRTARYDGIIDCRAALLIANGYRSRQPCIEGCIGLGSCVRACPFGAISMTAGQLAAVDRNTCTGCGVCVSSCPRGLLSLIPEAHKIYLACTSHGRGEEVTSVCSAGCTACGACVAITPSGAIFMHDNLPRLDYGTPGENFLAAASRCPSKCFIDLVKVRPKANIDTKCDGCGECLRICPVPQAITGRRGIRHVINKELCIGCGRCLTVCHVRAIALWGSLGYTADFRGAG
jgi:Na+-translocating ferredoxin:NAD+ oxidoreductase subunit B